MRMVVRNHDGRLYLSDKMIIIYDDYVPLLYDLWTIFSLFALNKSMELHEETRKKVKLVAFYGNLGRKRTPFEFTWLNHVHNKRNAFWRVSYPLLGIFSKFNQFTSSISPFSLPEHSRDDDFFSILID